MLSGKPYDTLELRELRERQGRLLAGSGLSLKAVEELPEMPAVRAAATEIALRRTAEAIVADTDGLAEHIDVRAQGTEVEAALHAMRGRDNRDEQITNRLERERGHDRPQYSQVPALEKQLKDWALLVHLANAYSTLTEF